MRSFVVADSIRLLRESRVVRGGEVEVVAPEKDSPRSFHLASTISQHRPGSWVLRQCQIVTSTTHVFFERARIVYTNPVSASIIKFIDNHPIVYSNPASRSFPLPSQRIFHTSLRHVQVHGLSIPQRTLSLYLYVYPPCHWQPPDEARE
jgi:hypothetical protein